MTWSSSLVLRPQAVNYTYFFKPYIHPAKSFVILPESTVETHAFSKVVANLKYTGNNYIINIQESITS